MILGFSQAHLFSENRAQSRESSVGDQVPINKPDQIFTQVADVSIVSIHVHMIVCPLFMVTAGKYTTNVLNTTLKKFHDRVWRYKMERKTSFECWLALISTGFSI